MKQFRKLLAWVCAVCFAGSGITALLLFNIERTAFDSATYKQAFEQQNLYQRIPNILGDSLHTYIADNANFPAYLKALTVDDWTASITSLLPADELKALTDNTLDSVFNYLNGKTDSVVISIVPFKNHLAGNSGIEVVKQILNSQPACTAEQLVQIGLGVITGKDLMLCKPPDEFMNFVNPLIESQLQVMTGYFPDQVTLVSNAQSHTPNDPRIRLNQARALMKITPVLPLLFLFCLTIIAVRSLLDWLKWWGYPFLITGAGSLFFALIGSPVLGFAIRTIIQRQGPRYLPQNLISALGETVSAVSGQILKPVAVEGAVLALAGFVMVVAALINTNRNKSKLQRK
jgi:hypothetical protein